MNNYNIAPGIRKIGKTGYDMTFQLNLEILFIEANYQLM